MGKKKIRPRSLVTKKIASPRTLLFRYLIANQKQKTQCLAAINDQKKYYSCHSLADFAYLAMKHKHLPDDCYRECRESDGKLNIYYGGVVEGDRVSNYGHMIITLERPKKNGRKIKMVVEFDRHPGEYWTNQKVWIIGKKEKARLSKTRAASA